MSTNNRKAQSLAYRFNALNQQLITFVEQCSAEQWRRVTQAEGWLVGVTAHHVGAIHYPIINWVQMMVEGMPIPAITMADVDQMNLQHVQANANCTPVEAIALLRQEGNKVMAYLQSIADVDLEREAYVRVFDATISAGYLFTVVLLDMVEEHLASMRATAQIAKGQSHLSPTAIRALMYCINDEIMNEGKLDLIPEIFDATYALRFGDDRMQADYGHDAVKEMYHFLHTTYADFRVSLNALAVEGDLAAANWTCVGTYQGESNEKVQRGQKVTWSGTSWFRVGNSRVLERWAYGDDLTVLA